MNRLAKETSPYLLQHAGNPVDWYPWGEEALDRARQEEKPILLSIGYSACHWCHVMAHESFEDAATARVMNEHFVNIKVDREERPDIDRIYQAAHHLLMRRGGGWPLTVFLAPQDLAPFFAGTYFPREPRYGMPPFVQVLTQVAAFYRQRPPGLAAQASALREALASLDATPPAETAQPDARPLARFREQAEAQFDGEFGGFGAAPKFPQPASMELLLRVWWHTARDPEPDLQALYMCAFSLQRMIEGGINDQAGGGFCRYSVDRHWSIPHFEKMLYDNAGMLALCSLMFQVSADEQFRRAASATARWALSEMRHPEGGFYSSLDADSGGEEGLFYLWTPDEVRAALTADEYAVCAARFGLDQPPNFEDRWHLRVWQPIDAIARERSLPVSTVQRLIDTGTEKLARARSPRPHPGRDDKILTSWNALMIRGLAIAGRALDREDLASAACDALAFLRSRLVRDGRLHACWMQGEPRFNAYLDDHAFLLDATLELMQTRWSDAQLGFAVWLADTLLDRFSAGDAGGFFFTSHDHEQLLHRSRSMGDDALPSGNAIAARALGRLGHLLGEVRYLDAAERTVRAAFNNALNHPFAHASMLAALDEVLEAPVIVVLRGTPGQLGDWLRVARAAYAPNRLVFAIPPDAAALPGALGARPATSMPVAWICNGSACRAPIHDLAQFAAALSGDGPPPD